MHTVGDTAIKVCTAGQRLQSALRIWLQQWPPEGMLYTAVCILQQRDVNVCEALASRLPSTALRILSQLFPAVGMLRTAGLVAVTQ